jgi:hypothetical protein
MVIAFTDVLIEGSGAGAKNGQWLIGSGLPRGAFEASTSFGS